MRGHPRKGRRGTSVYGWFVWVGIDGVGGLGRGLEQVGGREVVRGVQEVQGFYGSG